MWKITIEGNRKAIETLENIHARRVFMSSA
jgi:hypothetical protein